MSEMTSMGSFFRTLELEAADAGAHADAVATMRGGGVDAILVRGVYSPAECARLCARLEAGEHDLLHSRFPPQMGGTFLGQNLNLADPALLGYFQEAEVFREDLAELFSRVPEFTARVTGLLSRLDGGRPYAAPPGPAPGQAHMITTLRAHSPGAFIPPHFDNEQAFRASYRYVQPRIGADLFSFVLAFSQADRGGALEVFDVRHDGRPWRMAEGEHDAEALPLDGVARVSLRLAPGEMILFNSGRTLHHVTPVEGGTTRWTACSFMAESRDGSTVYCWG